MKQDHINYFFVGNMVIIAIVILVIGLYSITGSRTSADDYYLVLNNVSGIRQGSTVTYAGFRVGQVANMAPIKRDGQTHYRLHLLIQPDWKIPQDSTAQIVMPSFLGEKEIDITEGESKTVLAVGDEINGANALDIFQLAQQISGEFETLSEEGLKPLFATLTKEINTTVPQVAKQTSSLLKVLNDSADELLLVMQSLDKERIGNIVTNADDITKQMASVSSKLDSAAQNLDNLIAKTSQMMDGNNEDLRQTLLDLRTSMGVVKENVGSIMYNVDATARNMNEFTRQLRENPGVLLNSKPPNDPVSQ